MFKILSLSFKLNS